MHENGFFEITSGRKIIFHRWSPPTIDQDNANVKIKRSVEKFISSVAQSIVMNCPDAETIAFLASEWENFRVGPQFADALITEMKREIETRRSHWRLCLIFNDQTSRLYNEFLQTMMRLQSDEHSFAQFLSRVLSKTNTI